VQIRGDSSLAPSGNPIGAVYSKRRRSCFSRNRFMHSTIFRLWPAPSIDLSNTEKGQPQRLLLSCRPYRFYRGSPAVQARINHKRNLGLSEWEIRSRSLSTESVPIHHLAQTYRCRLQFVSCTIRRSRASGRISEWPCTSVKSPARRSRDQRRFRQLHIVWPFAAATDSSNACPGRSGWQRDIIRHMAFDRRDQRPRRAA